MTSSFPSLTIMMVSRTLTLIGTRVGQRTETTLWCHVIFITNHKIVMQSKLKCSHVEFRMLNINLQMTDNEDHLVLMSVSCNAQNYWWPHVALNFQYGNNSLSSKSAQIDFIISVNLLHDWTDKSQFQPLKLCSVPAPCLPARHKLSNFLHSLFLLHPNVMSWFTL